MDDFIEQLTNLLNCYSKEQPSDTPDYILSTFLMVCLSALHEAIRAREQHYDRERWMAQKEEWRREAAIHHEGGKDNE